MSSQTTDQGPIENVDVYCLVDLTEAQQESYKREIEKGDKQVDFAHPRFIPWTEDRDGSLEDLFRIYEEKKEGLHSFFFFIDRQCLSNTSMIIAQMDDYTLMYSEEALARFNEYLAKYPVEGVDEIHEGHLETLDDEAAKQGLTFGRVPASEFRSIWANLDISNMDMFELVEYCGGKQVEGLGVVEIYPNPDWDPEAFMQKLRDAMKVDAKL